MFRMFKKLTKKDWCMTFVNILLVVFMVGFELKIPEYMTEITQIIGTTKDMGNIVWVGFKMLLCAFGSALISIAVGFFAAKISANIGYRLRSELFSKVQHFSFIEIKKFSTPSLITRSTNDVSQVQMFVAMTLQLFVKSPIMAGWAVIKIINKNVLWSISVLVSIVLIAVVLCLVILVAIPKFKLIQKYTDDLNRVSRESLTGVRVVRAFNAEHFQEDKFEKVNDDITNNHLFINKIMSLIDPTMNFIMSMLPLSIYLIGAYLISNSNNFVQKLDVFSNMVVFSSYAIQVVMSFIMLVFIFMMMPRASVSASRINDVLDTQSSIKGGTGAGQVKTNLVLEFKKVGFKYPDAEEYILKDISFKVKKGQTIAFIGSTGSGKSTLVNLIPRLYDVTEGQVLVNGIDVKDYIENELNDKIGYISQRPVIFNGSVEYNVSFGLVNGKKPNDQDVDKALSVSQSNFVYNLKDGKMSLINQGGKNLSGGQKQRLSVARALARNPQILIFDDSFSALDYKTDQMLRSAIKEEFKDSVQVIVAQRVGTIKDADKIIVLDSGKVVGSGTHKELLETCDIYKEIALSQLNKEEL